ncbi:MAG TPA: hypothetical protein VGO91_01405 [Pyrinomonadaceae bacterium]|nr:hypothetical protein [Pyrinomonadaceae bacterium]
MRGNLYIPEEVKESISSHPYASIAKAVEGYVSGSEEEDTLTGGLGENLRISNQKVDVPVGQEISGSWTWSITFHKFRGRGNNATENLLGADGIFELSVGRGDIQANTQKKCLLFQAKNQWQGSDKSLFEQCIKLSTWREASFVLNYIPTDYETLFIDDVIRAIAVLNWMRLLRQASGQSCLR